jgi:hypothetical protein
MGLRDVLRRADTAVEEVKQSVIAAVVLAAAALVVGVIALVVAVVDRPA